MNGMRLSVEHGVVCRVPGDQFGYFGWHIGMMRVDLAGMYSLAHTGHLEFSIAQTESKDGGHTWSVPQPLNSPGSPPHIMRHSSGALIMPYGYRLLGFGQRVCISYDDGANWEYDWILRDDGPDWDLGYPSTVELPNGDLLTVYYQKVGDDDECSLLCSRWSLPRR